MKSGASNQPRAWSSVQLGEVAELCLGKMLDANKNKGRLLPYVRNPDVRWFDVDVSNLRLMPFEEREDERFGLKPGDVLVCEGGDAGRAAIWRGQLENVKFQKAIHRVRVGPRLDNRFLVHRLLADHQSGRLADYFTGATIKHLTGQDLARYSFALPPLAEQRRIADILDRADAMRAKRREAIALAHALDQAAFVEMFGDPAENSRGLPIGRLESVCKRITDGTHQPPKWSQSGHPFLFVANIASGEIDFGTAKFISDETHSELTRRCPIEPGDVLYSTVGSYGVPALVRDDRKFAFQRHIAHLKPDSDRLRPAFLSAMLGSPPLRRQADRAAKGVAQKTVNLADIRQFLVFVPPLAMQDAFVERVTAVQSLKAAHRTSLAEMVALFASLQHRAFHGEL